MKSIITSMLDDDLYKASMAACVYQHYPDVDVKYRFICRSPVRLGYLAKQIQEQVESLSDLRLLDAEHEFLLNLGYLPPSFLDWFRHYRYNPASVKVADVEGGHLSIDISGNWMQEIFWEVKLLAIVNELYFQSLHDPSSQDWRFIGWNKLTAKIGTLREYPQIRFAEFGTRRRFSAQWQAEVVRLLAESLHGGGCSQLVGTSNMHLARINKLTPIGTMAHEFISAHLSLVRRIETAQSRALHTWLQTYIDRLGYALTDTFTSAAFFRDFDVVLARAFAGVRQDSGDPYIFARKTIEHYRKLGIDPHTKYIVFSDGLDIDTAIKIWKSFAGEIGISFGIGTSLTNDVGYNPLSIVIKMVECNGKPVIKLSDTPEKATGDRQMIEAVKQAYQVA